MHHRMVIRAENYKIRDFISAAFCLPKNVVDLNHGIKAADRAALPVHALGYITPMSGWSRSCGSAYSSRMSNPSALGGTVCRSPTAENTWLNFNLFLAYRARHNHPLIGWAFLATALRAMSVSTRGRTVHPRSDGLLRTVEGRPAAYAGAGYSRLSRELGVVPADVDLARGDRQAAAARAAPILCFHNQNDRSVIQ